MSDYLDFKEAQCMNCYKCLKECPVKAIRIQDNQARIIKERCILCGRCTNVCPQNAKSVHSDINKVKRLLNSGPVIASVAPSFITNFNIHTFQAMENALKQLGFVMAEETARGAMEVTKKYEELLKTKQYRNFITSCCPSVNRMITLYYPEALKYLAPVDSPVIAHANMLKKEYPDHKIVFIGPCIAKKWECDIPGLIDGVLTFEEISVLFEEKLIDLEDTENNMQSGFNKARYYPISTGIIKSFEELADGYEYIAVDGTDRCMEVLEEIDSLDHVFLEINACPSACIGGPCRINMTNNKVTGDAKIRQYVRDNAPLSVSSPDAEGLDIHHEFARKELAVKNPTEEEIRAVLAKTGKYKPSDELNCGACGYNTCREKAWAVINGFADVRMCVPYMRERAESVSSQIMTHSPYGTIVVDHDFQIVDINKKAKDILGISIVHKNEDTIFIHLSEVEDIMDAIINKKNILNRQMYVPATKIHAEYSISYIREYDMCLIVMKDVTERVNYDSKLQEVKLEALSITDDVIRKQMLVAQQIASLLGETTAETKVALVNLKKTLDDGDKTV